MTAGRRPIVSWRCPVCRESLDLAPDERRWSCQSGHSFDVAREGYVNLLVSAQRKSRQPGDDPEMVGARRRFLATGAYDPLTEALSEEVSRAHPGVLLDVGCGEGRHTAAMRAPAVFGIDVAKSAVVLAARAGRDVRYAVANATAVPLGDGSADVATCIFGPVFPEELARLVRTGGTVVAASPGPRHLAALRRLVYPKSEPHREKPPLRGAAGLFEQQTSRLVSFEVATDQPAVLGDLFAMTPYRWHAPPDIAERLAAAATAGFETTAEVLITSYRRI